MAGVASTLLFLFWLTGLVIPPLLPNLPLRQTAADSLGRAPRANRPPTRPVSIRAERERLASRQRLFNYLKVHPAPPALRFSQMPVTPRRLRPNEQLAARPTTAADCH